jgi:triosephosphate isomerase
MGEVTANILKEYGVKYCAIGHREKREQGETDTIINSKVKRLMENGITPMICIGDSDSENENGLTKDVLRKQLQGTLVGVPNIQDVLICYRPSWTLGTGKVARGEYVNMIGEYVREIVSEIADNPLAKSCCFIYGGGISGANVEDYMKQVEIDGVFFVGASLKPDDFCEVLKKGGVLQ